MPVNWTLADQPGWQTLDVAGADPSGLAEARMWAQAQLTALGDPHRLDALLVAGELLDNAYLHAGGPVELRLRRTAWPCEVTVAVADDGAGTPHLRVPTRDGGRGLRVVDRLCLAWGVSHHDDGKLVWARLQCATSGEPCPRAWASRN
ncbi:ATP-binding protein [Amycolatopsis sp., V23-08]|uniref:ATP-binding protein n=1 Tax=Amycolatopsis heterodermiae TaxID=3110235 RepID=A0ABU5RD36_9PSEU|nr:ATP-binding protein [Amycolatopsis sp., V23-08]MEA5363535.1 ATP-binding protein [Amycolatopsis sp., V23-08]